MEEDFDVKCMKAAILNALVGWKTASVAQQSGLVSKFHVSFWGRSPEFLVALKRMNPEYVVGTRLHSFDLYFTFAKEWQLSTRLKALNALDFVAPISEHGTMHLKNEGFMCVVVRVIWDVETTSFCSGPKDQKERQNRLSP